MTVAAARTLSVDLTRFTTAGRSTVHGMGALAVDQLIQVIDEDADILDVEVLAVGPDGSANLRVQWGSARPIAMPPGRWKVGEP